MWVGKKVKKCDWILGTKIQCQKVNVSESIVSDRGYND